LRESRVNHFLKDSSGLDFQILDVKSNSLHLFLLYVSVILIITFLQQEFVFMPHLQSLDLIGDEAKEQVINEWQKWRWTSFLVAPTLLLIRLFLISLCLFVGSFFFTNMAIPNFKMWCRVSLIAQSVMILYSVVICTLYLLYGSNAPSNFISYSSLLIFSTENIEQWIKLPLSAINIFEIAYWLVLSKCVSVQTNNGFGKSFKFVMSSYGVGYLFYIVLLMFLMLYLN